ncbi:uncharacterized protein B0T23DRAFT_419722 [Neurospora hispaniola]|uniref:Uncharacterized protein n=1 Tax=Neurospora hispaniola TaxID=588809 RepID=A0AAJ0IAP7_9PEZI|nr:hypothetical protein B0T23DRAFT_419722 [Neurospora hispaniola]
MHRVYRDSASSWASERSVDEGEPYREPRGEGDSSSSTYSKRRAVIATMAPAHPVSAPTKQLNGKEEEQDSTTPDHSVAGVSFDVLGCLGNAKPRVDACAVMETDPVVAKRSVGDRPRRADGLALPLQIESPTGLVRPITSTLGFTSFQLSLGRFGLSLQTLHVKVQDRELINFETPLAVSKEKGSIIPRIVKEDAVHGCQARS